MARAVCRSPAPRCSSRHRVILRTLADGIVQFGPSPGIHTVQVSKYGYVPKSANRTVTLGSRDTLTVRLWLSPEDVGDAVAGDRLGFRAPFQNPSGDRVGFVLDVPAVRVVSVEVLDLMGRRVSRLHDG